MSTLFEITDEFERLYQMAIDEELSDDVQSIAEGVRILQYEDTLENWKNQYRRISTGEI